MSLANLELLINDQAAYLRNHPLEPVQQTTKHLADLAAVLHQTPSSVAGQGAMLLALLELGHATGLPFGSLVKSARNVFERTVVDSVDTEVSSMSVQTDSVDSPDSGEGTGASITKVNPDLNTDDRIIER